MTLICGPYTLKNVQSKPTHMNEQLKMYEVTHKWAVLHTNAYTP